MALQLSNGIGQLVYAPHGNILLNYQRGIGYEIWKLDTSQIQRSVFDPDIKDAPYFTPDGKSLVCIHEGGDVQLRDVASGKIRRSFRNSCFDSPSEIATNGKLIVGYKGNVIKVFDVVTGKLLRSLDEDPGDYFFSPNGKLLAVAVAGLYNSSEVRVWNITKGKRLFSTSGFTQKQLKGGAELSITTPRGARLDAMSPVLFSPDGKTFATGGINPHWKVPPNPDMWGDSGWPMDYAVKIWDARTGKPLRVLKGPTYSSQKYSPLAFSGDGRGLLCSGTNRDIWNLSTNKRTFSTSEWAIVSPDNSVVVVPQCEKTPSPVEIYALSSGKLLRKVPLTKTQNVLGFSPGNRDLIVADGAKSHVMWWDWRQGRQRASFATPTRRAFRAATFSPDGQFVGSSDGAGKAFVWNLQTGQLVGSAAGAPNSHIEFLPDGKSISLVSDIKQKPLVNFVRRSYYNTLSPDGTRVAANPKTDGADGNETGDESSFLAMLDFATKSPLWKQRLGKDVNLEKMLFSPDGKFLVTSQLQSTQDSKANLTLWDATTGRRLHVLNSGGGAEKIVFSKNGSHLAAAFTEESGYSVRVWNVPGGRLKSFFKEPVGHPDALALSPQGNRLVCSDEQLDLKLYDGNTGKRLLTWIMPQTPSGAKPEWLAYTPSAYYIAPEAAEKYIWWRKDAKILPNQSYREFFHQPDIVGRLLSGN